MQLIIPDGVVTAADLVLATEILRESADRRQTLIADVAKRYDARPLDPDLADVIGQMGAGDEEIDMVNEYRRQIASIRHVINAIS